MDKRKQIIILAGLLMLKTVSGFCIEGDLSQGFHGAEDQLEKLEIYFEAEMYDQAADLLDELITQFPTEPRFKYLKAIVDYQRENYTSASRAFEEFIAKYPNIAEPYYLLAEISVKKGNVELAKRYLAKYCELVPDDNDAQDKLESLSRKNFSASMILENGREDPQIVKKVGFYGACVHSYQQESIKLINGSFRTWSAMGIDFIYPVDLRGKRIILKLKGKKGGERLELTFRDKFAQDYQPQLVLMPEERLLTDWQRIEVVLDDRQKDIDLSSIIHMGLEFGFSTVQNPPNSTLFIQDIIVKDDLN